MGLTASLRMGSPREAEAALVGLVNLNLMQLREGVPPIARALEPDQRGRRRLRYIRLDPGEEWRSLRLIWKYGGGDCEDLAAAVAAELIFRGIPARVVIRRIRPGLWHALVYVEIGRGIWLDPSKIGGM